MKTAEKWAKRIQNSKEPWPKLVELIQQDALIEGLRIASEIAQSNLLCGEASGLITRDQILSEISRREQEGKKV